MDAADPRSRLYCAVDTVALARARALAKALAPFVGGLKLGLEFFTANGPHGVRRLAESGLPLFLDLKLHDIPNTVARAVAAALPLRPAMITVHAAGGAAMLRAAAEAARAGDDSRPLVIAVTVLTSLADEDARAVGIAGSVSDQVRRLAALASHAGCDGVVCAAREVRALRADCGPGFRLVVPGLRPAWAAPSDQKRVTTPLEALAAGADYLVIGRPITESPDPVAAARRILDELAAAG